MKYVVFEHPLSGPLPVMFPEHIEHSTIINAIELAHPAITARSKGICKIAGELGHLEIAEGSAGLPPQPEDEAILKQLLKQ